MMKRMFVSVMICLVGFYGTAAADSLICNGKIVSTGDTKTDVLMKCGDPAGRDSREEVIVEKLDETTKQKITVAIDEWTYNLGAENLVRVLTFRDGRLSEIRTTGYGAAESRKPAASCDEQYPARGSTKAEVLLKCGEPAGKDSRKEELLEAIDADTKKKTVITIDEWTYNFGPNKFIRTFEFRNNQLTEIKTGGYGY